MKNLPQKLKDPFPSGKPRVEQHMYLRVGDRVYHEKFKPWGGGIVIETWDSDLPGGHVCSEFYSRMERRGFLITATIAPATIQESSF